MGRRDLLAVRDSRFSRDSLVVAGVMRWFLRAARPLPWRGRGRSGYAGLVSEAMLQQTQVGRVVDRYRAFLLRFPSVRVMAAAREQSVLAMWSGLGYYRRARLLHAAARLVVSEFGGRVPRTVSSLLRLPGVGRYSAASIASLVYGKREPLVDGNVLRVLARLDARSGRTGDPGLVRWAWSRSRELVSLVEPASAAGVLNEGLMELGAVVCTPRNPRCSACPVSSHCRALELGRTGSIPASRQAPVRKRVHHHAIVVWRDGRVLLEQRPASGMWSRLWQVPTVEAGRVLGVAELGRRLARGGDGVGLGVGHGLSLRKCDRFVHQTTHRHVTFHVFLGKVGGSVGSAGSHPGGRVWRSWDQACRLPMSSAQRRVLEVAQTDA